MKIQIVKTIPLYICLGLFICFSAHAQEDGAETETIADTAQPAPKDSGDTAEESAPQDKAAPAPDKQPAEETPDSPPETTVETPAEELTTDEVTDSTSGAPKTTTPTEDTAPTEANEVTAPATKISPSPAKAPEEVTVAQPEVAVTSDNSPPSNATEDTSAQKEAKRLVEEKKRHMFVVTYNMANPGGATADFVDEFSFEGFGFEYRFMLKKNLSIGAVFGWSTFEKKEVGQFVLDSNTTIDGTRVKMVDVIQLAPSVHYYFAKQSARAVPFIGLNVGPYYSSHVVDWGWWYEKNATWQFGMTPEIGIRIAGLPVPLYLAVRYSYAVKANSLKAQRYLGINLGIAFLK